MDMKQRRGGRGRTPCVTVQGGKASRGKSSLGEPVKTSTPAPTTPFPPLVCKIGGGVEVTHGVTYLHLTYREADHLSRALSQEVQDYLLTTKEAL